MCNNNVEGKAEELTKKIEAFLNTIDETSSSTIFHYTTYKGLEGILKTRRLWLTDHKYLNDPSEIEHGKKILLDCIDKQRSMQH